MWYIGIIGFTISLFSVIFSFTIYPQILWYENYVVSDFGVLPETRVFFNFSLIIASLCFIFFIRYLYSKKAINKFLMLLFLITALALGGIGIFPCGEEKCQGEINIHFISSVVYFVIFSITIIFFGVFQFIKKNQKLSSPSIILGFASLGLVSFLYLYVKPQALAEITHTLVIGLWVFFVSFRLRNKS